MAHTLTQTLDAEWTERNIRMYGVVDIDECKRDMRASATYKCVGANMIVAGLMSDAQELMAHGDVERARQVLNIAKSVLFDVMDGEMVGSVLVGGA